MPEQPRVGSYPDQDVTLLLTDLSGVRSAQLAATAGRGGGRPAHLLPEREFQPTASYLATVRALLADSADRIALLCATLAELIVSRRGRDVVIVSIARAGTPVGVLVKRWLRYHRSLAVPHYSISVANGAGLDVNAVRWLSRRYDPGSLQFVDAWTSKGTVRNALRLAVSGMRVRDLDPSLAVLSDVASCTEVSATRDDILIPHACLGATMAGLLSRTFVDPQQRGAASFHAVISYHEWAGNDLSNAYLDLISSRYPAILAQVPAAVRRAASRPPPDGRGMREARHLASRYGAADLDLVNMGMSESARGFLRRTPRLLLVGPRADGQVAHLLQLARERRVAVRREPGMVFRAVLL